eukprot:gnl/MRDRNA2_/MRDRNA2_128822_c0_seq1.p1 gnl/MRDRNA2_/MRDRNA2_128822_c0~~gnl/MRDRNA2_/MRDRNA2_128822_c0_seq1.p1  ORF type:complete len:586 (-),score=117.70 gnl/MRDRNA2_/MRDRNA2_128822_c0_seq1:144-1901(-)
MHNLCCGRKEDYDFDLEDLDEVSEDRLKGLASFSYVGQGVMKELQACAPHRNKENWNVNFGKVIGEVAQSPPRKYWGSAEISPEDTHSDECLPKRMADVIAKAEHWVDITSLSPPDGKFITFFNDALTQLAQKAQDKTEPIIVRMLFGNIVGMPVDCDSVVEAVTEGIPEDANLWVWVGAWRRGVSWNHSKIIAVDSKHLFWGGHNLWDDHYLKKDPVHDMSAQAEGQVACDGHQFANTMWKFIHDKDNWIFEHMPDWMPGVLPVRVCMAHWPAPDEQPEFPPQYERKYDQTVSDGLKEPGNIPMVTMGRYGAIHHMETNPSDRGIVAALSCAKEVIRLSLQDLGPLTLPVPDENVPIPGGVWPVDYLQELAKAIFERDVRVEIILSNPHSVPGGMNPMLANYGNGWSCNDVASEITRQMVEIYPDALDADLVAAVTTNLKVTFMRSKKGSEDWPDGQKLGNHAKFFIIDDICYYLGSQNLYIANLAEWGILIDDKQQTQKILQEYWNSAWENSYQESDTDVAEIMDGLGVERTAAPNADSETRALALQAQYATVNSGTGHRSIESHEIASHYGVHPDDHPEHLQ